LFINFLGFLAGLLTLLGFLPYIFSIVKSQAKPKRVTWWIWSINSFILLTSYRAEGADNTLWLALSYCIGCVTVALLTLMRGSNNWHLLDYICLLGTIIAIAVWIMVGSLITFLITLIIDLCGVVPTIVQVFKDPSSEDRKSWTIWLLGGLLTLLLVNNLFSPAEWSVDTLIISAYPLQISITCGLIVFFSKVKLTKRNSATI
jgi:uncharacterized protein with PQ loop repeat